MQTPLNSGSGKAISLGFILLCCLGLCDTFPASAAGELSPGSGTSWWSLRPLARPSIPQVPDKSSRVRNPIDAFILAKLGEKGLEPSPEADRRTLIRRLYFDLVGLPPSPEQIEAFESDRRPLAYEKLVEELLASPRYGERWARHWLDVVHYGETHGYDKDKPRPNAWPYRDYVIRSFNQDKPYARFVQEQVAGDILFPDTRDGIEALGFIAAGPWDFIGHAEVPESKIDGKVARHLDRDDMVVNTLQTFNSLTVQCAQCHNHKFDPISQEDYYSLQSVFAAVDRTDKSYDLTEADARRRRELDDRQRHLEELRRQIEQTVAGRAGTALVELDREIDLRTKQAKGSEAVGYHSEISPKQDAPKWVQVDLGSAVAVDSVLLHPCHDDFAGIGDGFGFPVRFKVEFSSDPNFAENVVVVDDRTGEDVPNPGLRPHRIETSGRTTRYIRVTATKLALRQADYIFALSELEALTSAGTNAASGHKVLALDSIEAAPRWQKVNLTDGWYPGGDASNPSALAALQQSRSHLITQFTVDAEALELKQTDESLASIRQEKKHLPALQTAYVATVHTGSGAFSGTGAQGGKPRPVFLLNRGNVQKPGKEVGPGALGCVTALPSRFELPADHREGDRRAALAQWLSHHDNPLTWRSIVNRVWLYHFGRGLVDTANDFGRMGALPTHSELLDWLACEFRDGGQSLKSLHFLIVTSSTYRQSADQKDDSTTQGDLSAVDRARRTDADNRYLWRQNRRKLEAESIRDAVLAVSGQLNLTMGGPSFEDFVVEHPEHSPHYEYGLHNPEDPKTHRRSIYRFIVRSQPQPFMTVLDCADPSMQVSKRNESLSPLQALSLLNNALIISSSKHFAEKLSETRGDLAAQVHRSYIEATGRPPSTSDEADLTAYAQHYGLQNYCRLLLNLNEFSFVD
jgi:hypothetical protein